MAQKKIEIIYDIDGKAIDVAIQSTLNLQQQAKALTAELRRTKEGTEEFRLLTSKLGDVQDGLARTSAKSKDLFSSLSLLPGAAGAFFQELSGGIELLKLFSSFSFKDIQNGFKEVVNDLRDITGNLGNVDDQTKKNVDTNGEFSDTLKDNAAEAATLNTALKQNIDTKKMSINANGQLVSAEENMRTATEANTVAIRNMTAAELAEFNANRQQQVQALRTAGAQETQATTTAELTIGTRALAAAENAAAFATKALYAAIGGFVIGVVVALLYEGGKALLEWATGAKEAEKAQKDFNHELELTATVNDLTLKDAKRRQAEYIALLKSQGKTEKEIRIQGVKDLKQQLSIVERALMESAALELATQRRTDEKSTEDLKAVVKKRNEYEQTAKDLRSQIRIAELNDIAEGLKTQVKKTKETYDEILERERQFRASLTALRIQDEREKEVFQANADAEKERRDVEKLKIEKKYESVRTKLLEEIEQSRKEKIRQIDKKYDDLDLKAREEFNAKIKDNEIAAIENTLKRNIKAREEKYARDLKALEEDKQFAKKSEEEQAKIRKDVRQAAENDINDLIFEALIKRKTIELQALEAQQKVLVQGTQAYLDNAMQIEQNAYEIKKAQAIKNNENLVAIETEHASNIKNIEYQSFLASKQIALERLGVIKSIGTSLQALAGKNKEIAIAGIVVEKAAAIGEIIANTSIANAKAVAISPLTLGQPWVTINTIAAGLSIAATIKGAADAISQINSSGESATSNTGGTQYADSSFRGYATGGIVSGPGTGTSDSIQARLSNGESVMNAQSTAMFAPLLSMMNQMGGGASFNISAATTTYDKPVDNNRAEQAIIKTYVVEGDLTSAQHRQARLKDLSVL